MKFSLEPWEEQTIEGQMAQADALMAAGRYREAHSIYENMQGMVGRLHDQMVNSFADLAGGGGLVAGFMFPVIGGTAAAVAFGLGGRALFRYLAKNALWSLETVKERAIAGKVQCERLMQQQHS